MSSARSLSANSREDFGDTSPSSAAISPGTESILLIGDLVHAKKEWTACSDFARLMTFDGEAREQFLSHCDNGNFNSVVAIYRSNESTKLTGPIDSELVSRLPRSIRYICHSGAGYDNIDVAACTKRGICVSHTPQAVNSATADMTMFLILGALRRIHVPYTAIRNGAWRGGSGLGHDPKAKVLGILGMGGIGREVAHRARAFGMRVQYHNRFALPPHLAQAGEYVSFDSLLATSDVLSLNLSLTSNTRHIIAKPQFDMMKTGVVIVNTARGALMDEADLVNALESGKVFSVGLDVFEEEPKIHRGLLENEKVVILPHIGTATFETQRAMELLVLENLRSAVQKGVLITQVPEQRHRHHMP